VQLHDTVGHWLSYAYRCHSLTLEIFLRNHCKALGKSYVITPPQWAVLWILGSENGQTIGSIAQRSGVDAPSITSSVGRLEQHGLVERVHVREDRRLVKVFFTDEGRELYQALIPLVEEFDRQLCDTSLQSEAFIMQLKQIIAHLSRVVPGAGDRFGLLPSTMREDDQNTFVRDHDFMASQTQRDEIDPHS
jgi:DNA-binding MarR family transcriptional regulator